MMELWTALQCLGRFGADVHEGGGPEQEGGGWAVNEGYCLIA
jgi:hypothetical protein